ncbi:MAG: efflux RND transporter permease subunit [Bacteroidales bacterium]|jgi:HAE1 family hydrophobic/amphiphilic exporter-1|nr:efflux RND transporter permease subunit [Bacteroidales bacterium]HOL98524.1 efflux RND transporter permease subunit [Bacteroidales bacterium]HOM35683.1 efflux RND transporter permease subunit [Bacteroidales bacterium]HPD23177.1 efflux RND transporter permease subunit [Bacteroidales bacterium]HRS99106.1 efflux RND transporter permease subunit [Bacteroidales bacterium]
MKITKTAVNNPVATAMAFVAILFFGISSWVSLPKDLLPSIELPAITVITIYPGASAEDVETQVTDPLEKVLAGAENLKKINSVSRENVSIISLIYDWGTNISDAANSARDLMELVKKDLPADAMNPYLMKINSSMIPVVVFTIQAEESYNGLERIIYDRIVEPLKKLEGVGTAFIIAQPSREINILVDPQKLSAYKISISAITTILQAYNLNIPGGNIKFGKYDFAVRIPGKVNSIEEIKKIPISNFNNRIIRIEDVATVLDTYKDKDEIAYSEKNKAVALFVQKQTGANNHEVYSNVINKMEEIKKDLPPDIKTNVVFDTSQITVEVSKSLQGTIYYAALFVILVVFIFLRDWRNSFIVILTIPFSMMTAYITMKIAGFTINIFSLMSLIVAIGMVVDNAVVVLENINSYIERGAKPKEASIFATGEMGKAITASTLTTISVFVPLIFMGGFVGILFRQLAILVTVTMAASLITAITLTPMLSSLLFKPKNKRKSKTNYLFKSSENLFVKFENLYAKLLRFFVNHKYSIVILCILIFLFSLYAGSSIGSDYIPDLDAGDLITTIEVEVGSDVHETERVAKMVEKIYYEEIPEMVSQYTVIGQTETSLLSSIGFEEGKNKATISARLCLPQDRTRSAGEIAERIEKRLKEIPEIENFKINAGSLLQKMLLGAEKPIEIKISGKDFDKINKAALDIQQLMQNTTGFKNVENSIDRGKSEYHIIIDNERASGMGLNTALIGLQVRQNLYGSNAGKFTENNEAYNIRILYDKTFRSNVNDLNNIVITNILGQPVNLSSVAKIVEGSGPLEIKHEAQSRFVKVGAELDDISLSEGAKLAREIIKRYDSDPAIHLSLAGKVGEQEESFAKLRYIFVVCFMLVYMIMAAQFESFKDPFIIIFSIPFMITGVVAAFIIAGINLNIVTFVGLIMLLGIVVNNGIVLVDYTNLLMARGSDLFSAVVEAGRSRLRPVLITSLTTILAMIPMLFSRGIGSELWIPLAITMIGGLFVSLVITLIIVPCMYAILNRKKNNSDKI